MTRPLPEPERPTGRPFVAVRELAARQAGVVTRSQALAHGMTDAMLQHRVDAGHWRRLVPGTYATFTGPSFWDARLWAAVLSCGDGAAISHCCALVHWGMRLRDHDESVIHVAIDTTRRVQARPGVRPHRLSGLAGFVHPARNPLVVRFEHAVLLHASTESEARAIGIIADACQQRMTTPDRLRSALVTFSRMRMRATLRQVLDDVATGASSYLEVGYLRLVERPHGLPTGSRQRRVVMRDMPCFRDVEYADLATVVELDGRLGHEDFGGRWSDLDRDLSSALTGATTVRLGVGQVFGDPCRTAAGVGCLLRRSGWSAVPHRCGTHCLLTLDGSLEYLATPGSRDIPNIVRADRPTACGTRGTNAGAAARHPGDVGRRS